MGEPRGEEAVAEEAVVVLEVEVVGKAVGLEEGTEGGEIIEAELNSEGEKRKVVD